MLIDVPLCLKACPLGFPLDRVLDECALTCVDLRLVFENIEPKKTLAAFAAHWDLQ
jgi:hypothetical protein